MMAWLDRLFPRRPPPEPPVPGVYHLQTAGPDDTPYRLHLRVEPDGSGVLVANASTVLHLNPTAAEHAALYLQGMSEEAAAGWMASRYRVGRGRALRDTRQLREQLATLATRKDLDPVVVLGLDRSEPYAERPSAPYRLDLALTYRTDSHGRMDPLARRRVDHELDTDEWKTVLQTAWRAGIPHVTFTGGEPTLRADLIDLVVEAQTIGLVSGLLTDGRRLADKGFMEALSQAGLDHILVCVDETDPESLAGLRNAIASPVFTAGHITVTERNAGAMPGLLSEWKSLGLGVVSLTSGGSGPMAGALAHAREHAADLGLELVWDLPVPYSANNLIRLEESASQDGAGRAWLYIEPDGDVLPGQGVDRLLGNILRDPWGEIWRRAGGGDVGPHPNPSPA
jgi:Radical SAM superfamily